MLGHIPMFSHVIEQDSASMNLHFPSLQIINSTRRGGKKHHFSFIDVHVLLGCLFLMVLCPCCCMTLYVYIITIHTYTHTHLLRIAYRIVKLECILRAKHSNSKPGRKQGRQEVKFHRWRFHCTHNKIMYIYWDLTHTHTYTHLFGPTKYHQVLDHPQALLLLQAPRKGLVGLPEATQPHGPGPVAASRKCGPSRRNRTRFGGVGNLESSWINGAINGCFQTKSRPKVQMDLDSHHNQACLIFEKK